MLRTAWLLAVGWLAAGTVGLGPAALGASDETTETGPVLIERPEDGFAIALPPEWVFMTSPPEEMDALIENLERDAGPGAGKRLQWRFGYLGIVTEDWPPLYVLPTDEGRALGCGIETDKRPPRPISEWLDEVESDASSGPISFITVEQPKAVDLSTGQHLVLRQVGETPGRQLLFRTTYLIGGDDVEITVTCSSLEPHPEEYWRSVVNEFASLPSGERRVEVPTSGIALTIPDGWWIRTRGLGLARAAEEGEQHLWVRHPSGDMCVVWYWQQPPGGDGAGGDLDSFADAFIDSYREGAIGLQVTEARLPVGPAVRVDDELPSIGVSRVAWLLSDGSGFHSLTCGSPAQPVDSLLTIAETLEFLPAEE